jgi:hypothetical protein
MRRAAVRMMRAAARRTKSQVATKNLLPTPQTITQQSSSISQRRRRESSSTNLPPYPTTDSGKIQMRNTVVSRTLKIRVMRV